MNKYEVYWNAHKHQDCSDIPRSRRRIVKAESADAARDILVAWRDELYKANDNLFAKFGDGVYRYCGMIHNAHEVGCGNVAEMSPRADYKC